MLPAHGRDHGDGDDVEHHGAPAEELVGRDHLQEHRERRDHGAVGRVGQDVPPEVLAELEGRAALDRLHQQAGQHADQQCGDQHQDDGQGLGDDEGPVGDGRGLDDFVGSPLALAPDQLARVVDGDDDREDGESAVELLDHHPRHRVHAGPVELVDQPEVGAAVDQAQHQDDDETGAEQDLADVQAGADQQLLHRGREAETGRDPADHDLRRSGRLGGGLRALALAGPARAFAEPEQAIGQGDEAGAEPQDQQPVP